MPDEDEDPDLPMRHVKLEFQDSRYNYETTCNGTRRLICRYFNNPIPLDAIGDDGDGETVLMCPSGITFVDQNICIPFSGERT